MPSPLSEYNHWFSEYCSFPELCLVHKMSSMQPPCFQQIHEIGGLITPVTRYLYSLVLIASVWVFTFHNRRGLFKLDLQLYLHTLTTVVVSCPSLSFSCCHSFLIPPQSHDLVCSVALTIISLALELFVDLASPLLSPPLPAH